MTVKRTRPVLVVVIVLLGVLSIGTVQFISHASFGFASTATRGTGPGSSSTRPPGVSSRRCTTPKLTTSGR